MKKNGGKNLGAWMAELASKADVATAATLEAIQAKLSAEKQAVLEKKLEYIYRQIQANVAQLRELRKAERRVESEIERLQMYADDVVAGKVEMDFSENGESAPCPSIRKDPHKY